jgi:hypothetical protein
VRRPEPELRDAVVREVMSPAGLYAMAMPTVSSAAWKQRRLLHDVDRGAACLACEDPPCPGYGVCLLGKGTVCISPSRSLFAIKV